MQHTQAWYRRTSAWVLALLMLASIGIVIGLVAPAPSVAKDRTLVVHARADATVFGRYPHRNFGNRPRLVVGAVPGGSTDLHDVPVPDLGDLVLDRRDARVARARAQAPNRRPADRQRHWHEMRITPANAPAGWTHAGRRRTRSRTRDAPRRHRSRRAVHADLVPAAADRRTAHRGRQQRERARSEDQDPRARPRADAHADHHPDRLPRSVGDRHADADGHRWRRPAAVAADPRRLLLPMVPRDVGTVLGSRSRTTTRRSGWYDSSDVGVVIAAHRRDAVRRDPGRHLLVVGPGDEDRPARADPAARRRRHHVPVEPLLRAGGAGRSTVAQIHDDLTYITSHYGSDPSFLRIDGRPVVFVYADGVRRMRHGLALGTGEHRQRLRRAEGVPRVQDVCGPARELAPVRTGVGDERHGALLLHDLARVLEER